MTRSTSGPLPFEALEEALGSRSAVPLALELGVSTRSVQRYRHRGLSWERADELAVQVGLHPAEVWPEWTRGEEVRS